MIPPEETRARGRCSRTALLLPLIGALLSACAPTFEILTLQPGFDGTRTYRTTGNVLGGGSQIHPRVELNLERVDFPANEPAYYAVLEYSGSSWLSIGEGRTLTLVIDGDEATLGGPGSEDDRQVLHGTIAHERARYRLTDEQVEQLASAESAEVTVHGEAGSVRRVLRPRNLENLRTFLEQYGPART